MPIIVYKKGRLNSKDTRVLKLADRLISELKDLFVSVESIDGRDGSNVRIILRDVSPELIDRVIDVIWSVEEEIGEHGVFIPDILSLKDARYLREPRTMKLPEELIERLAEELSSRLGDLLVSVESIDGRDGSNVRIILRDVSPELIDRVIDVIWSVEEEIGEHGVFIPNLVSINES